MNIALTANVRRGLVVGALSLALSGAFAQTTLAGTPPNPYIGTYESIDSFDGSHQTITFGGPLGGQLSAYRAVTSHDDVATVCGGTRFFGQGLGVVDGDTLFVVLEQYCGNANDQIEDGFLVFTADASTGTLTDSYGIVWTRR